MTTSRTDRLVPRWLSIVIITVLGVFLLAALLFAWINSSSPPSPRGYSQFLADVEAGQVTKVEQDGDTLTVATADDRYTVVVPSVLTDVYGEMQAAADQGGHPLPSGVYVAIKPPDTSWIGLVLTGLLPLALAIIMFGFVVYLLARRGGGPPDATSRLRALDTAWKAGLVTDEERDRKRTQIIEGI